MTNKTTNKMVFGDDAKYARVNARVPISLKEKVNEKCQALKVKESQLIRIALERVVK